MSEESLAGTMTEGLSGSPALFGSASPVQHSGQGAPLRRWVVRKCVFRINVKVAVMLQRDIYMRSKPIGDLVRLLE